MTLALADAEIVKLARLLGTNPREVDFLRQVDWQDIRDLREQAAAAMFDADRQGLQRVAAATKLAPGKVTAAIGERAFGPLLCGRVVGLLDPRARSTSPVTCRRPSSPTSRRRSSRAAPAA